MKKIFTFGEIMLRISPYNRGEKIEQADLFRIEPGGSESNVAIALSRLGHNVSFISKIPDNPHKNLVLRYLRQHNVNTSNIILGAERMGLYWTENGVGIRATNVIYDRQNSSFSESGVNDFDWHNVNNKAGWFHVSGVTPAISENLYRNLASIFNILDKSIKISIDLNYRSKLWQWVKKDRQSKIKEIMSKFCSRVHLITANESDFQDIFGYPASEPRDIESYKKIAEDFFSGMKELRYIAISLRTSYSASENDWGGILFVKNGKKGELFAGPKYKLSNIVDRIGTGDCFTAGIIHGILSFKNSFQHIVDFATALSALNHTVSGDASQFEERDVEQILTSEGSGKVIR